MKDCIFCNPDEDRIITSNEYCYAVPDQYPVSPGHMLIIPKRHVSSYFNLTDDERHAIDDMIVMIKDSIDTVYRPTGYNIGINIGEDAGQSVMHCHIHLIPRYKGDVENPRGGVRGVIPSKQNY